MLVLHDMARSRLRMAGSLAVDADGDEILIGLSVSESRFFLTFQEEPEDAYETAENLLYLSLRHKHLIARRRFGQR